MHRCAVDASEIVIDVMSAITAVPCCSWMSIWTSPLMMDDCGVGYPHRCPCHEVTAVMDVLADLMRRLTMCPQSDAQADDDAAAQR